MDQKSLEEFRDRVRTFLATQTEDELSYLLGRYCGPSNRILSEKKFGYIMPRDLVEQELISRSLENAIFDDN